MSTLQVSTTAQTLWIATRQQPGVYIYTNVIGSETEIQFFTGAGLFTDSACIYYDPTHNKVWVGNGDNNNPTVVGIDPGTLAVTSVNLSPGTSARRITGDASHIYALSPHNPIRTRVYVVSTTSNTLVGILDTGTSHVARDMVVDGSGNLWVLSAFSNIQKFTPADIAASISGFPTPHTASGGTFLSGAALHGLCYDPVDNQIWAGTYHGNIIYQLNATTGATINSLSMANLPNPLNGLAYYNGFVWVGTEGSTVLKINPSTFPAGGSIVSVSTPSPETFDPLADPNTNTLIVNSRNPGVTGVLVRIDSSSTVVSHFSVPGTNTAIAATTAPNGGGSPTIVASSTLTAALTVRKFAATSATANSAVTATLTRRVQVQAPLTANSSIAANLESLLRTTVVANSSITALLTEGIQSAVVADSSIAALLADGIQSTITADSSLTATLGQPIDSAIVADSSISALLGDAVQDNLIADSSISADLFLELAPQGALVADSTVGAVLGELLPQCTLSGNSSISTSILIVNRIPQALPTKAPRVTGQPPLTHARFQIKPPRR